MNQTLSMMSDPRREQLNSLININRELAAGLARPRLDRNSKGPTA